MSVKRETTSKLVKMTKEDAAALERLTLVAQNSYRMVNPSALAADLPSANHVIRALIRHADGEVVLKTSNGIALADVCANEGQLWT